MNWKDVTIGAVAGVAAGIAISQTASRAVPMSPDKVLEDVKTQFKRQGTIDGSWIQMKPEEHEIMAVKNRVYRGGISRHQGIELEQFEFIADAKTGTVMDVYKI
ncbi:hypothetical protein [Jeotgalibacillus proteolyticus]|uniref:PepSY domain-containing protein n=1 Tax=Jeotgalibacillus proteolyticus TaxID=2082395 RepID=A0A2S5GF59_9BACL|nr:hypothetical protein [Jeotgalibacillus proteolyticus]PPA71682.1 hypothetical protein C4B60_06405 [Jeotgalibacillus proteolyticus]